MAGPGLHGTQIWVESLTKNQVAAQGFVALAAALNKFQDGYFTADAVGRAKIADGYVLAAQLADTYLAQFTAPVVLRRGFSEILNTDEPAPTDVEVNEAKARSFTNATTTEAKCSFVVPDIWDGTSGLTVHLLISPSTSQVASFDIVTEYRVNGGTLTAGSTLSITPSAIANTQTESVAVLTLSGLSVGDRVVVKVKRADAGNVDSHGGDMRLFEIRMKVDV